MFNARFQRTLRILSGYIVSYIIFFVKHFSDIKKITPQQCCQGVLGFGLADAVRLEALGTGGQVAVGALGGVVGGAHAGAGEVLAVVAEGILQNEGGGGGAGRTVVAVFHTFLLWRTR